MIKSSAFDKYYKKYDRWYEVNKFAYLSELKAVRNVVPKKAKGLEIGVGTGRFAVPLGITYGVDPSLNMVKTACEKGVRTRLETGEKLSYLKSTFDYVAIINTLCFAKDPCKVLYEAKRVLKKNGRIIAAIIDKDSLLGKYYSRNRGAFFKNAVFFGVEDVSAILKALGFNAFSYRQCIFNSLDKIRTVEEVKRGFGQGSFVVISARKSVRDMSVTRSKFIKHEKVRFLFKKYGYDMDAERAAVLKRAGEIKEPVLDVGTGPGRMAYTIAKSGYNVKSIDVSESVLKVAEIYARKYNVLSRIKLITMNAEKMTFASESFSTVVSANLLHDAGDPDKVVKEIIRVTKPGGKVVISDLNEKGKQIVNKVYKINKEIHKAKPIDLECFVADNLRKFGVKFEKYDDGFITTYAGMKPERHS